MSGAGKRKVPGRFVRLRGSVQLADRIPTDFLLDPVFLAGPSVFLLDVVNGGLGAVQTGFHMALCMGFNSILSGLGNIKFQNVETQ